MESDYETEISEAINEGFKKLAGAITPLAVAGGKDATGGHVESLTEAVMGMTTGLTRIADAIHDLASAVREHGDS